MTRRIKPNSGGLSDFFEEQWRCATCWQQAERLGPFGGNFRILLLFSWRSARVNNTLSGTTCKWPLLVQKHTYICNQSMIAGCAAFAVDLTCDSGEILDAFITHLTLWVAGDRWDFAAFGFGGELQLSIRDRANETAHRNSGNTSTLWQDWGTSNHLHLDVTFFASRWYSCLPSARCLAHLSRILVLLDWVCIWFWLQALLPSMSEATKQVVDLYFACADIMDTVSRKSIASYVISMTRVASHVMEVLFLGWFCCKDLLVKKTSGDWVARLVVAPLFETIPDLEVMG